MKKVLHVYVGSADSAAQTPPDPRFAGRIEWTAHAVDANRSIDRLRRAFFMPDPSGFDVIMSSEYYCALGVNLRLRLSGSKTRHLIWGLNKSRRAVDSGVLAPIAHWAFARSDRIVTHSRHEIDLFTQMHRLPRERFAFVPWGYDVPAITPTTAFSQRSEPYVCLIGRNNRDLPTFAKAIEISGLRGVAIVSNPAPNDRAALERAGVEIHQNLPMNDSLDCLRHAAISAVLLQDDGRGAGHITMVSALQLGVPQVVSRAEAIADYVQMPEHGLAVPMHDAAATAQAFTELMHDPERRARIAQAAREAGWQRFSHATVQQAIDAQMSTLL